MRSPRFKIFIGMSGGVDSSVSAALLKKAGHEVTGVFIKVWQPDWIECNWKEERLDAMRAAAHLEIPFVTLDLEKEYKSGVIDYMISEYGAGRTPNPDVMCNREVKFGAFWRWAKGQGADFIATGHYARNALLSPKTGSGARIFPCWEIPRARASRARKSPSPASDVRSGYSLLKGVDANKDQSYFLWTLNQNDLPHILFPVGGMTKPEVRKLAKRFKLPNAEKKDSQGLCFIGKVDVKEFLKHYIKTEQGNVVNEAGEIIGSHPGALLFTIGERHGFTIDPKHKSPADGAYYVAAKDNDKNALMVKHHRNAASHHLNRLALKVSENPTVLLRSINWMHVPPKIGVLLQARSRYRQELQKVRVVSANASEAIVKFDDPQDALTSGQSVVIYDGEECLGGGVIE